MLVCWCLPPCLYRSLAHGGDADLTRAVWRFLKDRAQRFAGLVTRADFLGACEQLVASQQTRDSWPAEPPPLPRLLRTAFQPA